MTTGYADQEREGREQIEDSPWIVFLPEGQRDLKRPAGSQGHGRSHSLNTWGEEQRRWRD
eukprot:2373404-Pyramimonas_sp.AAC.1